MIPQSGFDIKVIVNELNELNGSRIEKFYNTSEGELLIKIYSQKLGKQVLRVLRGESIHMTDFQREVSDSPSNFTMLMRKYMNGAVINSFEQPSFERIVIMNIKRGDEVFNIVLEMFNKGNIVICDKDMKIVNALRFVSIKDRVIKPNQAYELPSPRFLELYTDGIEFKRTIKLSSNESIVKCLAIDIGLGGKYAEELCSLAGIDKNKNPGMLSNDEAAKLFDVFFLMYKSVKHYKNMKPCVITREDVVVNFAPFPFKSYQDCEFKFFETFNEACDYYYSRAQKEDYENQAKHVYESKINQLEKRRQQQEDNLTHLKIESEKTARIGEVVFSNYDLINTILSKLKEANKNNISWEEIKKMVEADKERGSLEANAITDINEADGFVTLSIEDVQFNAPFSSSANEIAQDFFEKSKKMKGKIGGTEDSIQFTSDEINKIEEKGIKTVEKIVEKNKEQDPDKWYKKFRWLFTSNGFLLVCGRDATQNEIVVKKIAEDNDLIFHASIAGSPFGILKNGKNAKSIDKEESASFVASYSRAWRDNIPTDVFCVEKSQVSKTAPSGEYVGHGSFVIKGEKETFKSLWPEVAIGYNKDGEVIAGPVELMKKNCERLAVLNPGNISPGKISKRLISLFDDKTFRSEEFLHFIPGDSMLEI